MSWLVSGIKLKYLLAFSALIILVSSLLPTCLSEIDGREIKTETQNIPEIEDPTPGYWETSEYMIGTVAVDVIFLESNGTIDPNTEDWTSSEMSKVMSEIKIALDWWEGQSPFVKFLPFPPAPPGGYSTVPTSYEPISRNQSEEGLWISDAMSYFGYTTGDYFTQVRDYVTDLRNSTGADWAFVIFVVDSSKDPDGCFTDKIPGTDRYYSAFAQPVGPYLVMTYDNDRWGIDSMDQVCAHETGHIFWATDEYNNVTEYGGYLNVSDIEGSGALMENNSWTLSGATHGLNGTWGQIGWRDSDSDGIPDIVDTIPNIILKSDSSNPTTNTTITYTGTAIEVAYPNMNPSTWRGNWTWDPVKYNWTWNPTPHRNVTINKFLMVEFRIDFGNWTPTNMISGLLSPVVNFTFFAQQLSPGNHTIEVQTWNQWGQTGYTNTTVTIIEFLPTDLNKDGIVNILDLATVAQAFGTREGDTNYNVIADLDKNGEINILDLSAVAMDYGKTL